MLHNFKNLSLIQIANFKNFKFYGKKNYIKKYLISYYNNIYQTFW